MQTVDSIMAALDAIAPQYLCVEGDPRGLLIGDGNAAVTRIVTCLDVTPDVAEWAVQHGAQMIIAHHPLIYNPLKRILTREPHPGGVVITCIRAGIAVACAHTNWDVAEGGVNDVLAGLLGLENTHPVQMTYKEYGLGRIGALPEPIPAEELLRVVKSVLQFDAVRMVGPTEKFVHTVAVGGGACAFLVPDALRLGADALVTSDVRHHEYVDAAARGLLLLDAGHAQTETPGARELANRLQIALPDVSVDFR